jgi:hypothetical protein
MNLKRIFSHYGFLPTQNKMSFDRNNQMYLGVFFICMFSTEFLFEKKERTFFRLNDVLH